MGYEMVSSKIIATGNFMSEQTHNQAQGQPQNPAANQSQTAASEAKHLTWSSWLELSERDRKIAVHKPDFWSSLTPEQQRIFFIEADWQEIRVCPEAKKVYLDSLLSFEEVCKRLDLTSVQMAFLISTRKMPAALVGGYWKHDWYKVQKWVEGMGGLEAVHKDVEEQIRKHKEGQKG
jgi:hypothetical protein